MVRFINPGERAGPGELEGDCPICTRTVIGRQNESVDVHMSDEGGSSLRQVECPGCGCKINVIFHRPTPGS